MDVNQRRLELLDYVSTLLEDGSFTSTYKYALLIAMIDCSSEAGGAGRSYVDELSVADLAARCIELYWSHTEVYTNPTGAPSAVLRQNNGAAPAIFSKIRALRDRHGDRIARSINSADWKSALKSTAKVLWDWPIDRLQCLPGGARDRLYPYPQVRGAALRLREHVAADLAALAPILRPMILNAWCAKVRSLNTDLTAHADSLQSFLFGAQRSNLAPWRPLLRDLQGGRCLYCNARLTGEFQVDHFIPWAKYPADIAENFVGSCARCNGKKSDHLAAEEHVEHWWRRNDDRAMEIAGYCSEQGLLSDAGRVIQIAANTYAVAERRGSLVWVRGSELRPINTGWRQVLHTGFSSGAQHEDR